MLVFTVVVIAEWCP